MTKVVLFKRKVNCQEENLSKNTSRKTYSRKISDENKTSLE